MTKQKKYLSILLASIAMVCCFIAGLMQFNVGEIVSVKADDTQEQSSGDFTVDYQEGDILLSTNKQFTVKVLSKGEALDTADVIFNDVYTLPELPEGSVGWYLNNKKLTGNSIKVQMDLTIEAKYPTDSFNVTFHYIGADYEETTDTKAYLYGTLISPELHYVQNANGYNFVGWGNNLVLTEDMDVYAEYGYEERTDDTHTVKHNEDGSVTLINNIGLPGHGALLQTYNYYTDFELEFTISDNNTTSVMGMGPAIFFGDKLFYLLASGYDASGNKRYGKDAQPEGGVLVYDNTEHVIPGWYVTPLEATVRIVVKNHTFELFIKADDGTYYKPKWWPSAAESIDDTYSTTGKIGFGFRPKSTGSYTLSNISIKNLNEESNLFVDSAAEYDVSNGNAFSVEVSTNAEIQSLWVENEVLDVDEYSVSYGEGKATIEITAEIMGSVAKYLNEGALNLGVFTSDGKYDNLKISYKNLQIYNVKFISGNDVVSETSVAMGSLVVLPACPENSIGWYIDGKKINASVMYVYANTVIEAKFETDMFTVEFVYRNIRNNEKVEVKEFVYGTQFTDELFVAPVPNDYIFTGWNYSGVITENIRVTANYERYASGKDFTLDFDGVLENKNYINYVSLNYPGGYTDLANNYMYTTALLSGSAVYTNQQYKDFEMTLDVVHYSGGLLGDNNISLTFASEEQEVIDYYKHPYSIVMSLQYNSATGEYYSVAYLLKKGTVIANGRIVSLCDTAKITLEDNEKGAYKKNIVDSGLSPNGKYVQLKLTMQDGIITLESKYNTDSVWTTAFSTFVGKDVLGYLSVGYNTEYLYSSWGVGIDNLSVRNLNDSESGLPMSIPDLQQNAEGVYEYKVGTTDIVTNVNFKMQAYGGINVIVYDDNEAIVDDISVDIIKEEIYEIGDFVTLDKRVLGEIFNKYATGDTLRIDVVVLAKLDWGCVSLELTKPDAFTVEYWNGDEKFDSVTANIGDTITLPTNVTVPTGYVFGGWTDEYGNELDASLVVVDNYKLSVILIPYEYTVRFMNYDGTVFYQTKVKYGQKIALPLINPLGTDTIQFIEWENADLIVSGNVDINAKWSGLKEKSSCKGSVQSYDFISLMLVAAVAFVLKKKLLLSNKG